MNALEIKMSAQRNIKKWRKEDKKYNRLLKKSKSEFIDLYTNKKRYRRKS